MQKTFTVAIAITCNLVLSTIVLADSYDKFIKTQLAEFQNPNTGKCKEKKIDASVKGIAYTYELCLFQGTPVFLRTSDDGTPISVSSYKKGKLVNILLSEATVGVGFRNGQPVVEYSSGEFSKRGVNWNLSRADKAKYLKMAAEEKSILRKFGF